MALRMIFTPLAVADRELTFAHSSDCPLLTHHLQLHRLFVSQHTILITISWTYTCYALCLEHSSPKSTRRVSIFRQLLLREAFTDQPVFLELTVLLLCFISVLGCIIVRIHT